jgi:SAM-dependent methyltransferase
MDNNKYSEYLKTRSWRSFLYRKFWLYPKIVKNFHQGRVLDIGCGIGDMLRFSPYISGVDINPETVKFCNDCGLNAILMQEDVLPFKNNSFKNILLDNVLEHIEKPKLLLEEIKRVLDKEGIFIVGVPGEKGFDCDDDHKQFYNEKRLTELLYQYEFKLNEFFYAPFKFKWFDKHISQYCLYGVFIKSS